MKKIVLNALVSGCLATMAGTALAADTGDISFIGEITTSACSIGGGQLGTDMTVQMGNISTNMFSGLGSKSPEVDFTISLLGCDTSVADTAHIAFRPGAGSVVDSRLLSLENGAGAQGVAVGLATAGGTAIVVGGAAGDYNLIEGTNILRFKAFYEATAATVTAGSANARAVFEVTYS
ncbi:fimbrial protein [Bordetella sp. BOR01]|uniref:fimbrial protein n=1 Tax=Bordetella sp. BOR01 TaxID=2854779 RepID=UPI001C466D88|nr:fimbrial protein [Bordetella sp. BOR01]MBV7483487.1 type 1 fimbrial protein [Bordetella sp. BOR01]